VRERAAAAGSAAGFASWDEWTQAAADLPASLAAQLDGRVAVQTLQGALQQLRQELNELQSHVTQKLQVEPALVAAERAPTGYPDAAS
jgi:hypothetical protein